MFLPVAELQKPARSRPKAGGETGRRGGGSRSTVVLPQQLLGPLEGIRSSSRRRSRETKDLITALDKPAM
jgi:hypothetical protein